MVLEDSGSEKRTKKRSVEVKGRGDSGKKMNKKGKMKVEE